MVAAFEMVQFLLGKFLHVQHHRMRRLGGTDEFVELELHGFAVAVLGVLDQEHHQESDDGGAGVDDELPSIAEMENRAGDQPDEDNEGGQAKGNRLAGEPGALAREFVEAAPMLQRFLRGLFEMLYGMNAVENFFHEKDAKRIV